MPARKKLRKPQKPSLPIDSTISLLRDILAAINKSNKLLLENNAISLASHNILKDTQIELEAQGQALASIEENTKILPSMEEILEDILEAIRGPQAQSATLTLVAGN